MAYSFVAANNDYIQTATAATGTTGFTYVCWLRANATQPATNNAIFYNGDSTANGYGLQIIQTTLNLRRLFGGIAGIDQGAGVTAGTWAHIGLTRLSSTSNVYIDGTGFGAVATIPNNPSGSFLTVGGIATQKMNGDVAEFACWNIGMTAADMAILANGYSPLFLYPENLIEYIPLIRDVASRTRGVWTINGAPTVVPHPRMIYPKRRARAA